MISNMSLEDVLLQLAKYGRPTLNQFAVSATSGITAAGDWHVEVHVPTKREAPQEAGTGRRLMGKGLLREAADECLKQCEELAESDNADWYKFVSEEDVRKAEKTK